ncbi:MAG: hypothetical protein VYA34_05840 [Myxococcota bacterium]|nr:hypothetical protein [Myxococcota bacterium]
MVRPVGGPGSLHNLAQIKQLQTEFTERKQASKADATGDVRNADVLEGNRPTDQQLEQDVKDGKLVIPPPSVTPNTEQLSATHESHSDRMRELFPEMTEADFAASRGSNTSQTPSSTQPGSTSFTLRGGQDTTVAGSKGSSGASLRENTPADHSQFSFSGPMNHNLFMMWALTNSIEDGVYRRLLKELAKEGSRFMTESGQMKIKHMEMKHQLERNSAWMKAVGEVVNKVISGPSEVAKKKAEGMADGGISDEAHESTGNVMGARNNKSGPIVKDDSLGMQDPRFESARQKYDNLLNHPDMKDASLQDKLERIDKNQAAATDATEREYLDKLKLDMKYNRWDDGRTSPPGNILQRAGRAVMKPVGDTLNKVGRIEKGQHPGKRLAELERDYQAASGPEKEYLGKLVGVARREHQKIAANTLNGALQPLTYHFLVKNEKGQRQGVRQGFVGKVKQHEANLKKAQGSVAKLEAEVKDPATKNVESKQKELVKAKKALSSLEAREPEMTAMKHRIVEFDKAITKYRPDVDIDPSKKHKWKNPDGKVPSQRSAGGYARGQFHTRNIEHGKKLLDSGEITPGAFEALRRLHGLPPKRGAEMEIKPRADKTSMTLGPSLKPRSGQMVIEHKPDSPAALTIKPSGKSKSPKGLEIQGPEVKDENQSKLAKGEMQIESGNKQPAGVEPTLDDWLKAGEIFHGDQEGVPKVNEILEQQINNMSAKFSEGMKKAEQAGYRFGQQGGSKGMGGGREAMNEAESQLRTIAQAGGPMFNMVGDVVRQEAVG